MSSLRRTISVSFPTCSTARGPERKNTRAACIFLPITRGFALLLLCLATAGAQTQKPTTAGQTTSTTHGTVAPRDRVDMLAAIEKSGKLRVGVAEIVPWAMHDKDGKLIGFEVDVARKLARDMGVEVEFHPAPLSYLISDLLADRTDIVIAGLSIKADRALKVNFSAPYNSTQVTLAANARSAAQLSTLDAFNKPEITIGALVGSTAEEMTSILLPKARIHTYLEDGDLFRDLIAGKLDAAAADSPRPEIVSKLFPASVVFPPVPPLATFPAAFAVRRGDMDFVNFLNSWVTARTENRWLEDRRTYWFKTMDWGKDL
jgi:polar amino acid transport system substrate-binding protein